MSLNGLQRLDLQDIFSPVSGLEFHAHVHCLRATSARFSNLSLKPSYGDFDCWLNTYGTRGFAVGRDGELTNVFSVYSFGDNARGILDFAKIQYDELHLNCFSGRLEAMYRDQGFQVRQRVANWHGQHNPDVVYMSWRR